MAPLVALMLAKILDYLAENADEMIAAIKDKFLISKTDPEVNAAIQELGYAPTVENLDSLHDLLKAKGENPGDLASLLVSKTVV